MTATVRVREKQVRKKGEHPDTLVSSVHPQCSRALGNDRWGIHRPSLWGIRICGVLHGGVGVFCVNHVMFPGVMFDGAGWGFKCCASAMESTGWCFIAALIKFGCVLTLAPGGLSDACMYASGAAARFCLSENPSHALCFAIIDSSCIRC
jgi:hypothetical protein